MADESDARQEIRTGTLKGASILTGRGRPELRCLIRNISPDGAELELGDDIRAPAHFTLHVPHEGIAYRAEVRWREAGRIGVRFNGVESRPRPALRAVAS